MGLVSAIKRQATYWWKKNRDKKPLAQRMRASAVRKGRRFVLGTPFVHWCINRLLQVVAAELFLWILVWWASDLCMIQDMFAVNLVVPCVISGIAQLAVRDVVIEAMGKHTSDMAALVQQTLQKRWDQTAFWVVTKTVAGVLIAVVVVAASRAQLLNGPILEIATIQVLLTMFVVDLIRNKEHPVRRKCRETFEHYCQRPKTKIIPRRRYVSRRNTETKIKAIVASAASDLLDHVVGRVPVNGRFFTVEQEVEELPKGLSEIDERIPGNVEGEEEGEGEGEVPIVGNYSGDDGDDTLLSGTDVEEEEEGEGEEEEEKIKEEADGIGAARALVEEATNFMDQLTMEDVTSQLPEGLSHYFSPIVGKWQKFDKT